VHRYFKQGGNHFKMTHLKKKTQHGHRAMQRRREKEGRREGQQATLLQKNTGTAGALE
jgi:hypothetical protein